MTVHFSNSQYDDISLTEQITFQNLLYTIKFEPQENSLKANLLASSNQVIRDETLILDASNSFISNMPQSVQRRSLGFRWNCPEPFIEFCRAEVGDRLEITQADLNSLSQKIEFKKPYEFSVTVVWAKPDGNSEEKKLTESVVWFDLTIPQFKIAYAPKPLLITSTENT